MTLSFLDVFGYQEKEFFFLSAFFHSKTTNKTMNIHVCVILKMYEMCRIVKSVKIRNKMLLSPYAMMSTIGPVL